MLACTAQTSISCSRRPVKARGRCSFNANATAEAVLDDTARYFSRYKVYKQNGALSIFPLRPEWKESKKGNYYVDRVGALAFEFARPKDGFTREYDWQNSIRINLSVFELGKLLEDPVQPFSLYHDPNKGREGEGTTSKRLDFSVKDNAYGLSAGMTASGNTSQVYVSLTAFELAELQVVVDYCIPKLLGFDRVLDSY